jgi:chromosome segregation ATPase
VKAALRICKTRIATNEAAIASNQATNKAAIANNQVSISTLREELLKHMIANNQAGIGTNEAAIANIHAAIANNQAAISTLREGLALHHAAVQELDKTVEAKNATIAAQAQELSEQKALIQSLIARMDAFEA